MDPSCTKEMSDKFVNLVKLVLGCIEPDAESYQAIN